MVLNIAAYRFVAIDDPRAVAERIRATADACGLLGSVLVAGEGLNLFLAGPADVLEPWLQDLCADSRFAGLVVKRSYSERAPFARLKVKVKAEIIAFRQPDASPLTARAPAVAPQTLARWLDQGHDDAGRRVVLLDTRNREEVAYGAFRDAVRLPIDNFTDLPAAIAPLQEQLADATIVSYCTGGIRCEKAALWLREHGLPNTLQLDGGILGYFEAVGGHGYEGACFVFDERVALDARLEPIATADEGGPPFG
jgi:UPF0176 protein